MLYVRTAASSGKLLTDPKTGFYLYVRRPPYTAYTAVLYRFLALDILTEVDEVTRNGLVLEPVFL